jgi:hypothetical protein
MQYQPGTATSFPRISGSGSQADHFNLIAYMIFYFYFSFPWGYSSVLHSGTSASFFLQSLRVGFSFRADHERPLRQTE